MKILFIFDTVAHYHEPLFRTLDAELNRHGHTLFLLSGKPKAGDTGRIGLASPIIANQRSYRFTEINALSYTLRYQHNIVPHIKEINPDIIIVPSHVGNITSWILGRNKNQIGYRLYAWQCGYEYHHNDLKIKITNRYLRLFDHHLAYHNNARQYLLAHDIDDSKISVIFNTIDESKIERTDKNEARHVLSNRHPVIQGRKIVLFVGAVLAEKGLNHLLDAFAKLNRTDACLVIVGDGPYLEAIRNRAQGLLNVLFTGRVIEEVGYYFDAADVFVLPGTGGLAINEAMAHGLPVIAGYADGSADDLVLHGKTGYRLQSNTAQEIADYLALLLDDDSLRQRLGKNAFGLITGDYSFKNFVNRVMAALLSPAVAGTKVA